MMNIKIERYSSVPANPAGLAMVAIVSQNMGIVTRTTDPKFLCFNDLRRVLGCGILYIVTSYVMS